MAGDVADALAQVRPDLGAIWARSGRGPGAIWARSGMIAAGRPPSPNETPGTPPSAWLNQNLSAQPRCRSRSCAYNVRADAPEGALQGAAADGGDLPGRDTLQPRQVSAAGARSGPSCARGGAALDRTVDAGLDREAWWLGSLATCIRPPPRLLNPTASHQGPQRARHRQLPSRANTRPVRPAASRQHVAGPPKPHHHPLPGPPTFSPWPAPSRASHPTHT